MFITLNLFEFFNKTMTMISIDYKWSLMKFMCRRRFRSALLRYRDYTFASARGPG